MKISIQIKIIVITIFQFFIVSFLNSQMKHPYLIDGYFLIEEGNNITAIPNLRDASGDNVGALGYDWSKFDGTFYLKNTPANGIVFSVKNQHLEKLGVVSQGKKTGVWIQCAVSGDPEYLNSINEVALYKEGSLITKSRKIENSYKFSDCNCSETGFFEFTEGLKNKSLYDQTGHLMDESYYYELEDKGESLDYYSTIYSKDGKAFNGVRFLNESGSCYVLIESFQNGSPNGLKISLSEMGYVIQFGLLSNNIKTGFWIENQYDGNAWKVLGYQEGMPIGVGYYFNESGVKGRAMYYKDGQFDCEGDCE